ALALLTQHNGWLVWVRLRRIGEFGRVADEAGHGGEAGVFGGFEWNAVLRAVDPVGVGESIDDRVVRRLLRPFDSGVVGVSICADRFAGFADAEQILETEIGTTVEVLVVEAGLEAGHYRAARFGEGGDLFALV